MTCACVRVCVNIRCWSAGQTLTSDTLWRKSVRRTGCENIWPRSKLNIGNAPLIYGRLGWATAMPLSSSLFVCVHACMCVCVCVCVWVSSPFRWQNDKIVLCHPITSVWAAHACADRFNCVTCQSEKTNSKLPAVVTAHFSCCAIKFNIKNSYCATCVYREVRTLRERSGRSDSDDARASCTCREAVGSFPECPMVHHNVSTVAHNG